MDAYVPRAFHVDEVKRLEVRIKQLEIGHDEWRTHARRAKAEVERLRATVTHLEKVNDELNEDAIALGRENARLRAITNSGHSDDCGGMDTSRGECECGWLQQEGAHAYITRLEARIEATLALCTEIQKAEDMGERITAGYAIGFIRKALKGEKP